MCLIPLGKPPTTSPGKGKEKAQDTFQKELSVPAPKTHSKHLEIWYNKFKSPHRHREGAKGQERGEKESEGWLRAREVSFLSFLSEILCIFLVVYTINHCLYLLIF